MPPFMEAKSYSERGPLFLDFFITESFDFHLNSRKAGDEEVTDLERFNLATSGVIGKAHYL